MLGGRYGWVPSKEPMDAAKESLPEQDKAFFMKEGISTTKMVIFLRALGYNDYTEHSFFCFRNENIYGSMKLCYKDIYIDNEEEGEAEKK